MAADVAVEDNTDFQSVAVADMALQAAVIAEVRTEDRNEIVVDVVAVIEVEEVDMSFDAELGRSLMLVVLGDCDS